MLKFYVTSDAVIVCVYSTCVNKFIMRSEFDLINNFKKKYSLKSVGDDCAVLPKNAEFDQLITADMLVEDVDFRLNWTKPEYLGHKSLAVSLSDIAAMGGKPVWAMLSIAVPENLWRNNFLDEFYDGWHKLAAVYSVELIGGDISRSPDKLIIDSIVGGEVSKGRAVMRSTAKVSDLIAVSGSLGGAAAGLALLETGINSPINLRQLKPEPRTILAQELSAAKIPSAMMVISDGFSADLAHICAASNVGAKVFGDKIPIDPSLETNCFDKERSLDLALNGGEDFELLFTTDRSNAEMLREFDVTVVGEITAAADRIELIAAGETSILESKGFRHF